MAERNEVRNGQVDWQVEKCREWLDQHDGSVTDADDRLKEALREFEVDYFGKHGTFDSCGHRTGLEDGYTEEYYKARYWFLKERGLELPDDEANR